MQVTSYISSLKHLTKNRRGYIYIYIYIYTYIYIYLNALNIAVAKIWRFLVYTLKDLHSLADFQRMMFYHSILLGDPFRVSGLFCRWLCGYQTSKLVDDN